MVLSSTDPEVISGDGDVETSVTAMVLLTTDPGVTSSEGDVDASATAMVLSTDPDVTLVVCVVEASVASMVLSSTDLDVTSGVSVVEASATSSLSHGYHREQLKCPFQQRRIGDQILFDQKQKKSQLYWTHQNQQCWFLILLQDKKKSWY